MFYSQVVLTKKGPLAKVWIAAHWEGKLTKQQILQVNLKEAANAVANPEIPIALRISGHLLLGICRIYSRKVKYLLQDCNDALVKIKLSFRPGAVDAEKAVAARQQITIPTRQKDFSEDSDVNDMFNFTNLAMDLQLDEQLNAEELKELTGNFTANMNEITLNHNYKDFRDEMNDFSMSMDELQMHALDDLFDPGLLREQESEFFDPVLPPMNDQTLLTDASNDPSHLLNVTNIGEMKDNNEDIPLNLNEAQPSLFDETTNQMNIEVENDIPINEIVDLPADDVAHENIANENENQTEMIGEFTEMNDEKGKKRKQRREKKIIVDSATVVSKSKYAKIRKNTESLMREFDLVPGSLRELREEQRKLRGKWEQTNERIKNYILFLNRDEVTEKDKMRVEDVSQEDIRKQIDQYKLNVSEIQPLKRKSQEESSEERMQGQRRKISDVMGDISLVNNDIIQPLQFDDMTNYDNDNFNNDMNNDMNFNNDFNEENEQFGFNEIEKKKQAKQSASWTMRSAKIHEYLKKKMRDEKEMSYKEFVQGKKRKPVVGCFFELLVLKTQGVIDLEQNEAYDDIIIKQTETFLEDVETQV